MRRISAHYVFPVTSAPVKNGIVELSDSGEVLQVIDPGPEMKELRKVEFYNGILVPGFINSHCHLELSFLKDKIERGCGLTRFIKSVRNLRNAFGSEVVMHSIQAADREMRQNGIVAVGDISNTAISLDVKAKSSIYYHTFIEVFGIKAKAVRKNYKNALNLYREMTESYRLPGSLTPHAPYSVTHSLLKKIVEKTESQRSIFSVHHQECSPNEEFLLRKKGKWLQLFHIPWFLFQWIGRPTRKRHTTFFDKLPARPAWLLVHNNYSLENDILMAEKRLENPFWVFCPRSNLFIENKLPDIPLFFEQATYIAIGTDSLASNDRLSVLDEIKTIQQHYPGITLETLIQWATLNGAKALKIDDQMGSIEKGKKPGLNLISGIDFEHWKLKENASVKRMI